MGGHTAGARRRGRNEGSIYKDEAKGRWYGAISLGYDPDGKVWRRHKVSGRTAVGQQFTSDDAADSRAGTCTRRGIPGSGAGQDA